MSSGNLRVFGRPGLRPDTRQSGNGDPPVLCSKFCRSGRNPSAPARAGTEPLIPGYGVPPPELLAPPAEPPAPPPPADDNRGDGMLDM
jgi:hypothetical protein